MKWVQIKIDPTDTASLDSGWMDPAGVKAATEKDLARQAAEDEDDAMRDAARYARRVRRRLGQLPTAHCCLGFSLHFTFTAIRLVQLLEQVRRP